MALALNVRWSRGNWVLSSCELARVLEFTRAMNDFRKAAILPRLTGLLRVAFCFVLKFARPNVGEGTFTGHLSSQWDSMKNTPHIVAYRYGYEVLVMIGALIGAISAGVGLVPLVPGKRLNELSILTRLAAVGPGRLISISMGEGLFSIRAEFRPNPDWENMKEAGLINEPKAPDQQ